MSNRRNRGWTLFLAAAITVLSVSTAWAGALAGYVNAPDPNFTYSLANTIKEPGYTAYVLDMTSQSWREGDVTPHLWKHWVTIVVPDARTVDDALLVVTGGNNKHDKPPDDVDDTLSMVAMATGAVLIELQGVPSEPLEFADETRKRSEDEIIAYTYDKYLKTGDPAWPLLCPMVKSAVRAMDAAQAFCAEELQPAVKLDGFVVTGGSKRGWTSWLTAAVDNRVIAIAPIVIDMLNLDEQMKRQMAYYGRYSEAIQDYTDFNIQERINTERGQELLDIVDPYEYRDELTLPKFVILGVGDQYWTVDAANLYFPGLKGPKWIRYEPNADHGLDRSRDPIIALATFFHNITNGKPMPEFTWDIEADGWFRIEAKDTPKEVRVWKAYAPDMDFRLKTIGEAWASETIEPSAPGVYTGQVAAPAEGHVAFFVELVYPSPLGFDWSLTTLTAVPRPSAGIPPVLILVAGIAGLALLIAVALLARRLVRS